MDTEKIKEKIPFLKNVDFSDPDTRKTAIKVAVAVLGVVCVLLLGIGKDDGEQAVQEPERSASEMDMPEGEDNDILSSGSAMDARMKNGYGGQRSYGDIYDGGGNMDDPMAPVSGGGGGDDFKTDVFEQTQNELLAAASQTQTQTQPAKRSSGGGGGSVKKKTSQEEAAERVAKRKKEMMAEAGLLDENGNPKYTTEEALYGRRTDEQSVPASQPESAPAPAPEEPAVAVSSVRRSGSLSTAGAGGNLTSLRDREQTVTTDEEHLFKVMFASSEKITSGARVSLRLLEDMVVDGVLVPANTYLAAIVTFDQRLSVTVSSIEFNGRIHAIRYEGYDTDGMRGLYCPSASRESATREAGRNVRNIGTSLLGSSVGSVASQLVNTGVSIVERAKDQQEIAITAGYTFFLRKAKEGY